MSSRKKLICSTARRGYTSILGVFIKWNNILYLLIYSKFLQISKIWIPEQKIYQVTFSPIICQTFSYFSDWHLFLITIIFSKNVHKQSFFVFQLIILITFTVMNNFSFSYTYLELITYYFSTHEKNFEKYIDVKKRSSQNEKNKKCSIIIAV